MNDNATIATSPEFEASIARRALLLGVENLSRILPQLDATQSRILQRGMEAVLSPRPSTKMSVEQFPSQGVSGSRPAPGL